MIQIWLNLFQSLSSSLDTILATLMTFVNISLFMHYSNLTFILPSLIVFSIGFCIRLSNSIGFNFSRAFTNLLNGISSAEQCTRFLLLNEIKFNESLECSQLDISSVNLNNFNFYWNQVKLK